MRPADSPLIFALDYPSIAEAEAGVRAVIEPGSLAIGMVKVGLELFVEEGPKAAKIAETAGLPLFLDLKLHDIPETVERAVGRASSLGARLLTVHASGGPAMLARAVERAAKEGSLTTITAVTILTSLDDADVRAIGYDRSSADQAVHLSKMAFAVGVRAFVCSSQEAGRLRSELGPEAILVTPGVRPGGSAAGDQKRVATPAGAIAAGSDWLVVGRPIRDAVDPRAAAKAIAEEARQARETRQTGQKGTVS